MGAVGLETLPGAWSALLQESDSREPPGCHQLHPDTCLEDPVGTEAEHQYSKLASPPYLPFLLYQERGFLILYGNQ